MNKKTVVLVFMGIVCLSLLGAPTPGTAQYLGETTWLISVDQNEHGAISPPPTIPLTGAVTRLGGSYYAMQGYIEIPGDGPFIVAGSGVLLGDIVYMNLTTSQLHTDSPSNWRDTGVMQVQINKNNLNGTFYEVGHDFQLSSAGPSPFFDSRFTAGSITLTGPFIPLGSNPGGPMSMLLLD